MTGPEFTCESGPAPIPASALRIESKRVLPASNQSLQIVYMGAVDWGFIRQRPQQLALQLSRHHKVLYVCQRSPLAYSLRHEPVPPRFMVVNDNLEVLRPRVLSLIPALHRYTLVRAVNQRLIKRGIQSHLKGGRADLLWLSSPWDYGYQTLIESSLTCYDCLDNQQAMRPTWDVTGIEESLFGAVDVVFASSEGLRRRAKAFASQAFLVGNAVDFDHFAGAATEALPAPPDLERIPGPRVGFFGTIGFWVDLDLMKSVAQNRRDWSFLVLGPQLVPASDTEELAGLPNVHFLGSRDYHELPAYLQHVDLWWLPFRVSDLTRDIDPVKVYECLAAGQKVVATRLPEMEKFLPMIQVASGVDEFLAKMEAALTHETNQEETSARVRFASQNTWEHRLNRIIEVVMTALERMQPRG